MQVRVADLVPVDADQQARAGGSIIRVPGSIAPGSHSTGRLMLHLTSFNGISFSTPSFPGRHHLYDDSIDLARRFGGPTFGGPLI